MSAKAGNRISAAQSLTNDQPPCPAAAKGLGGHTPIAPRMLNPGAALPAEISKTLSRSVQDDTTDATHTFTEKVTFNKDQPRLVRVLYTGSTMLRPGEIGVVLDTIIKNGEPYKRVTNTNSAFSLEYIVNGTKLLIPGDTEGWGSWDSPLNDALYNPAWTPVVGETWGPSATDGRLQRGYPGFRINGQAANGLVPVVREEFPILTGLPDSAILGTATGTISIYARDSSSDITGLTDTTWNVTAVSRFPVVPQGAIVKVDRINGVWTVTNMLAFQPAFLGKTEEAIASGATGTVGVWSGAAGSEGDLGFDLECHNKWEDVASGEWVWIGYNNAVYYIIKAPAAATDEAAVAYGGLRSTSGDHTGSTAGYEIIAALNIALPALDVTVDTSGHDLTITVAGDYYVSLSCSLDNNEAADANLIFGIFNNGSGANLGTQVTLIQDQIQSVSIVGILTLAANDVIDARFLPGSGKTYHVYWAQLTVHLLKAA